MKFSTQHQTEEDVLTVLEEVKDFSIIVFNDDVNTFDHVIESLMIICKHEWLQAEQCALLIHTTGKTVVKSGEFKTVEPMCTALLDRGITAEIIEK
jgi:ATP-dependent Clp protease adaptor protein ClpS